MSIRDRLHKTPYESRANEEKATTARSIMPAENARVDHEIDISGRDHDRGSLGHFDGVGHGNFCAGNWEC